MPTRSLRTLATGARQFVVHDALEMTWWFSGVVDLVEVDAEDDRRVGLGRRRGDDDLLRARLEVLGGVRALGEEAGRLDDDVDAEVAPRQRGRVALGEHLDLVAVDDQHAVADGHLARERAVDRVVLEQVAERPGVGDVVDRDDLDVSADSCAARKTLRPMRPKPLMPTRTAMRPRSLSQWRNGG